MKWNLDLEGSVMLVQEPNRSRRAILELEYLRASVLVAKPRFRRLMGESCAP